MTEFDLLSPTLEGARFRDHSIPLEFLKDLAVFEEFVISVAKAEWLRDNDRHRTPPGFMKGVEVKLKQINSGSAIPVLVAIVTTATALIPQQVYLERARDRIIEAVAAAESNGNVSEHLTPRMLTYFDRFGRGLREGESISFHRDGGRTPARLTPETRQKLVLSVQDVEAITKETRLLGTVVNTSDNEKTFTVQRADGQYVMALLTSTFRSVILDAQKESIGGIRVAVHGIGQYNRGNRLIRIESVDDVVTLDPLDVTARFEEFKLLRAGWLNGNDGKHLDSTLLDELAELFSLNYSSDLPLPYSFPTAQGGVQFEWRIGKASPEIEIHLESFQGEWLGDDEATLDLITDEGWANLVGRIKAIYTQYLNEVPE